MNKYILLIGLFTIYLSCKKDPEVVFSFDKRIYGRWLEVKSDFESQTFKRSDRFSPFDKALTIFENNTLVERSDSGVCIGDSCLTEDYIGIYDIIADNTIKIKVKNLKGFSEYKLRFEVIDSENMIAKKIK